MIFVSQNGRGTILSVAPPLLVVGIIVKGGGINSETYQDIQPLEIESKLH
jgi:hypothetical protein